MKKLLKRTIATVLTVVMLLGMVPIMELDITASAAETYSGTCGDNLTWTLDTESGELVISGNGEMDFSETVPGWESYKELIKSVNVDDGVTSIGLSAFSGYNLISATIPDSVTVIDEYAFAWSKISNMNIGDGINYIGIGAFRNASIENAVQDGYVVYIGNYLIDTSIHVYGDYVVKDGTRVISGEAFSYCESIKSITIPDSVVAICDVAFSNCDKGFDLYYNGTVEQWCAVKLNRHIMKYTDDLYIGGKLVEDIVIKNNVYGISELAFYDCDSLKSVEIADGVESIGVSAFYGCDNLVEVKISDSVIDIGESAFHSCSNLNNIECGNGLVTIGAKAFMYCTNLKELKWGNSLKTIGDYAFFGCAHLNIISIPNGVNVIGDNSFSGCTSIKSMDISDSVENIGESSFAGCTNLEIVSIGEGVATIEDYTFIDCDNLKDIIIPKSVTWIKPNAFSGWFFQDGGEDAPDGMVYKCVKLEKVYYLGTEEEWKDLTRPDDPFLNATIHFLGESEHKHELTHHTVESTCTVAGMEYDICFGCGESFNVVTLPLADHSWSEWKIRTDATGSAEGEKYRTCSVCGKEETDSIPKLNVIEDKKTGIVIEFDDEYDSGIEIKVEEVFDGASFQILEQNYGNVKSKIFDISTVKDGIKVQPNGKVKVRIPLPEGFGQKPVWVNYIDSINGTVVKISATVVNDYVEFETDHFSYYAIVEEISKVNSVSINDISMSYKDSATVTPSINADSGVKYTVSYSSSDSDVVSVDSNGRLTTNGTGDATITVTVTDEYGNTVTDTCEVNVSYQWWQWIIVIVLFGWIWY